MKKKLVILISGNGSNLQAVIDAINNNKIDYRIEAVVSNKKNAFGLERAEKAGIKTMYFPFNHTSREEYDAELAKIVEPLEPDYIFLLGWMRILTNRFISFFKDKLINLHPALPNSFAGTEAIKKQYNAFKNGKISKCGIMTHFVIDETVDLGPVILSAEVLILQEDTLEEFEERIHKAEHLLVIKTLKELF